MLTSQLIAANVQITVGSSLSRLAPLGLSLLGPVLLALALPPFKLSSLAFVSLVPLFLLWSRLGWREAFCWGWFSGTLIFVVTLYWLGTTVLQLAGYWSLVLLLLLCAMQGLAVAATALIVSLCSYAGPRIGAVALMAAAWTLSEWARTHGLLGVPFGELGVVAAGERWLLPLAALGGVYFLTMIVALINAFVASLIAGPHAIRKKAALCLVLAAAVVIGLNLKPLASMPPPSIRVAVAQGNIEQNTKWAPDQFERSESLYEDLTRHAAAQGAKLIVWPETAITRSALQDRPVLARLKALTAQTGSELFAGTLDAPHANAIYNAVIALGPGGSVDGVYHKRILVPFAEYVPFESLLRRGTLVDSSSSFSPGSGPASIETAGYSWAPLICYESLFTDHIRAIVHDGADILVIATDDAWFSGTSELSQHAAAAVVDAAATGHWVVRAASTGISAIIDPRGNIVHQLDEGERGFIVAKVGRGIVTPYDRFGENWLLGVCLLIVIYGLRAASKYDRFGSLSRKLSASRE